MSRFVTKPSMSWGVFGMDPMKSRRVRIRRRVYTTPHVQVCKSPTLETVDAYWPPGYAAMRKSGAKGSRKPVRVRHGPATVTGERTRSRHRQPREGRDSTEPGVRRLTFRPFFYNETATTEKE